MQVYECKYIGEWECVLVSMYGKACIYVAVCI